MSVKEHITVFKICSWRLNCYNDISDSEHLLILKKILNVFQDTVTNMRQPCDVNIWITLTSTPIPGYLLKLICHVSAKQNCETHN